MSVERNVAVRQLLDLLAAAFDGTDWHSLLGNLRSVAPEEWPWTPPGGSRSLRAIVQHVGSCKLMYDNHAFGDAALTWDHPLVLAEYRLDTATDGLAWLRECQAQFRGSVALLSDADLAVSRMTNWGELRQTSWIIRTMLEHDLYHAGEINHLRALFSGDDRWEHERES